MDMKNGSILIQDHGHFITYDEWRRRKRERRESVKWLKRLAAGVLGFLLTIALIAWGRCL